MVQILDFKLFIWSDIKFHRNIQCSNYGIHKKDIQKSINQQNIQITTFEKNRLTINEKNQMDIQMNNNYRRQQSKVRQSKEQKLKNDNRKYDNQKILSLWHSGIGFHLGRNRLWVRFLAVSDIYPMFIGPTITWVPSWFSGYIWFDTKIVLKKQQSKERQSNK